MWCFKWRQHWSDNFISLNIIYVCTIKFIGKVNNRDHKKKNHKNQNQNPIKVLRKWKGYLNLYGWQRKKNPLNFINYFLLSSPWLIMFIKSPLILYFNNLIIIYIYIYIILIWVDSTWLAMSKEVPHDMLL